MDTTQKYCTDGAGFLTNNAGSQRIAKYGDRHSTRSKYIAVIITADVITRRIIGIESHIEGSGPSGHENAQKHGIESVMKDMTFKEL